MASRGVEAALCRVPVAWVLPGDTWVPLGKAGCSAGCAFTQKGNCHWKWPLWNMPGLLLHRRLCNSSGKIPAIMYEEDEGGGDSRAATIIGCSINTELKNRDVPQKLAAESGYNFLVIWAGSLSYEYTIYRAISSNPFWSFVYHVRGKYYLVCLCGSKEHTIFVSLLFPFTETTCYFFLWKRLVKWQMNFQQQ